MSNKNLSTFPSSRLRRSRSNNWIRNLLSENELTINDLIWPVFICEGNNKIDEKGNTIAYRLKEGIRFKPLEYLCEDMDIDILEKVQ